MPPERRHAPVYCGGDAGPSQHEIDGAGAASTAACDGGEFFDAIKPIPGNGETFGGPPPALEKPQAAGEVQLWSGVDPPCKMEHRETCKNLPSATFNQKPTAMYDRIQVGADR